MRLAQKLTDQFYEALDKSGARIPIKAQVEELVKVSVEQAREQLARVAHKTHKLGHLDTCRCKRCCEADKIAAAIRTATLEDS
jgi:hypothetical protein